MPRQVVGNATVFEVRWEACSVGPESQVVPRLLGQDRGAGSPDQASTKAGELKGGVWALLWGAATRAWTCPICPGPGFHTEVSCPWKHEGKIRRFRLFVVAFKRGLKKKKGWPLFSKSFPSRSRSLRGSPPQAHRGMHRPGSRPAGRPVDWRGSPAPFGWHPYP